MWKTWRQRIWRRKTAAPATHDAVLFACEQIRQNVKTAVDFLKERLSGHFSNLRAFYRLPWYLVIGPGNAGKTTLLAQSDLPFLEKERFVQFTPDHTTTVGTINWWFTPNAALIDVPGHFLLQTKALTPSRAAWLELLRVIKHYRRRHPVNGVILVLSVETLLNLSAPNETDNTLLTALKTRLEEVFYRFKQRLPVYVVCHQIDKIAGFAEYFDDLGKTERQQQCGMTFALPVDGKAPDAETFAQEFDRFLQNLQQRVLWRLHQEREAGKRLAIHDFPQQLNHLKENLQKLIYALSTLGNHVALRGVYFTSAKSTENTSVNTVDEALAKHFSLLPVHKAAMPPRTAQVFFIKELFDKRIFPEAALANSSLSTAISRQEIFLRAGVAGLILVALSGVSLHWWENYQQQTHDLNVASNALTDYKLLALTYNPNQPDLDKLLPALNALQLANNSAAQAQLPWLLRFQLHAQQPLTTLTARLYQRDLENYFIPSLRTLLAQQLNNGNVTDNAQLYGLLKAYLMLGDPAHIEINFLSQWFAQQWKNNPALPQILNHLNAATTAVWPASPGDTNLITQTRATLNALPNAALSQAILNNELLSNTFQPVAVQDVQNNFVLPASGIAQIYSAAQLPVISQKIDAAIAATLQGNWVLGNKNSNTVDATINDLQQALITDYAQAYANAWQTWLNNIQIKHFASLPAADTGLQELTSESSPLIKLLAVVMTNTDVAGIPLNDPTLKQALQDALVPTFTSLITLFNTATGNDNRHIKNIFLVLQQLQQEVHTINQAKNPGQAALLDAQRIVQNQPDAVTQLFTVASQLPAPLQGWLQTIASNVRDLIMQQAYHYVTQQWQQQVLPQCISNIAERYPVQTSAVAMIPLHTFSEFFGPQGNINQFYQSYLTPFIDTSQASWQWRQTPGDPFVNDTATLAQFERANVIKYLYFNNAGTLQTAFNLTLVSASDDVNNVQLQLNGKIISETPEAGQTHYFAWPSGRDFASLMITDDAGKTHAISAQGPWALFQLISQGQLTTTDDQHFDLVFNIDGYQVHYALVANSSINPFIPGVIGEFRCPRWG